MHPHNLRLKDLRKYVSLCDSARNSYDLIPIAYGSTMRRSRLQRVLWQTGEAILTFLGHDVGMIPSQLDIAKSMIMSEEAIR